MKLLVLLSLFSSSVFAEQSTCKTYEAQVFGGVVQTLKVGQICLLEVDIVQISENRNCPLARVDIELSKVEDVQCEYKLGDEFSGYIIHTPGSKYLVLDK